MIIMEHLVNINNLKNAFTEFKGAIPFDHCVVDNFLSEYLIEKIESEFLDFNSDHYYNYNNPVEIKKQNHDWGLFPKYTYQLFNYLNSQPFLDILSEHIKVKLYADSGLHGGGWHIHDATGILNQHLDYSLHPKLELQRKINIIIYVTKDWQESYGGHLGLFENPDKLVKEVSPMYNRAIVFDTTQDSWHGLSRVCNTPTGVYRKSLAIYYLTDPPIEVDTRNRALFAPREDQKNDPDILKLIESRSK
jgi:hypothetical protein